MNDGFAEFVHGTATQLLRTATLLTGDHQLAEDLTQTTYTKLFASWRRVRRTTNPVGYAHTTLLNTFLSHQRVRRNRELPTDQFADRASVPSGTGADARLDLLAALAQLTPLDRAVLVTRYWEDRSVTEAATALGISESAVRTRARRALQRIRPLLGDGYDIELELSSEGHLT